MKLPEKEWFTLPEMAWVSDPDRNEAEVIEELLVKHVFGDSGKHLAPACKIEAPGVRVLRFELGIEGENGHVLPTWSMSPDKESDELSRVKGYLDSKSRSSTLFSGYLTISMNAETRNSGKTTGTIELNQPNCTPLDDIFRRAKIPRRSPVVRLYHILPDGTECRVEPLGSLEVAEKDLLFHLDNMRRFVKGNQAQEKRLEQLIAGDTGRDGVPLAPVGDEVEQAKGGKPETGMGLIVPSREKRIAVFTEQALDLLQKKTPRREIAEVLKRDGATNEMIGMILTNDESKNRISGTWEKRGARLLKGELKGFV